VSGTSLAGWFLVPVVFWVCLVVEVGVDRVIQHSLGDLRIVSMLKSCGRTFTSDDDERHPEAAQWKPKKPFSFCRSSILIAEIGSVCFGRFFYQIGSD
jgi:hypothetical protein